MKTRVRPREKKNIKDIQCKTNYLQIENLYSEDCYRAVLFVCLFCFVFVVHDLPWPPFLISQQETAFLRNCRRTASVFSKDPVQLLVICKEVNTDA